MYTTKPTGCSGDIRDMSSEQYRPPVRRTNLEDAQVARRLQDIAATIAPLAPLVPFCPILEYDWMYSSKTIYIVAYTIMT